MDPTIVGLIGIGVLLLLMFLGSSIGFAFIFTGFAGLVYLQGLNPSLFAIAHTTFNWVNDYTFAAVAMFVLMGQFVHHSGIASDLYNVGYKWIGQFRGGLAMATSVACAFFAAISGSSMATAATMGMVSLPEIKKFKYSDRLATGCVAASGTVGILIPPSLPFIIYGLLTETSISKLFMADILPGILAVTLYCLATYTAVRLDPKAGPAGPSFPWKKRLVALGGIGPMLVLFVLMMGSIYLGIATPTEAAAIGAGGSFLFIIGKRRLTKQNLIASLLDTGVTATFMLTIFIGAMIFGIFLTVTGLPGMVAAAMRDLAISRYFALIIVLVLYLPLGCVLESMAMIVLTVPTLFPGL